LSDVIPAPGPFRRARPRKAEPTPTTSDALEIAMDLERHDPSPDSPARKVLIEHHRLLSEQVAQSRLQRLREYIAVLRDFAAAGLVALLLFGIVGVLWSASRAEGLVVEPFSVPPAMAQRGLDGPAVASLFLDKLSALQAGTQSGRAPSSYGQNWGDDLAVEIADTGVSMGDIWRSLRRWLGHESRMTGGVVFEDGKVSIVVRNGAEAIEAVTGPEDQLDALLQGAAERVYRQTQPYRYTVYIGRKAAGLPEGPERTALVQERRAILERLTSSPSKVERAWAYNGLAVLETTTPRQSLPYFEAGLEAVPEHPYLLGNLSAAYTFLGHDQQAYDALLKATAATRKRPAYMNPQVMAADLPANDAAEASSTGDYLTASRGYAAAADVPVNNTGTDFSLSLAEVLAVGHDPAAARRRLVRAGYRDDVAAMQAQAETGALGYPWARIALEEERWAEAVRQLELADAVALRLLYPRAAIGRITLLWPDLAWARARSGDLAGARALIERTPKDCYLCVTVRGRIAALEGKPREADRWFAEAVRQAPRLPFAYSAWGEARAARGEYEPAIALFRQAQTFGPRWADPLKYEADVWVARGQPARALARYRKAEEFAPRWRALHQAWGDALARQGKRAEAEAQWKLAAS
jgi:tetratricopeptide (TPR) repeat protein